MRLIQSYWDSPEACCIFNPKFEEILLTAIHWQIDALRRCITTFDVYLDIMEGVMMNEDDDTHNERVFSLTDYNKFEIRKKCFYLLSLYKIVEEYMPGETLKSCCERASKKYEAQEYKSVSYSTIMQWKQQFQRSKMLLNLINIKSNKEKLPP